MQQSKKPNSKAINDKQYPKASSVQIKCKQPGANQQTTPKLNRDSEINTYQSTIKHSTKHKQNQTKQTSHKLPFRI